METPARVSLPYSTDEEFENFLNAPFTGYTYTSSNIRSRLGNVEPPHMSRLNSMRSKRDKERSLHLSSGLDSSTDESAEASYFVKYNKSKQTSNSIRDYSRQTMWRMYEYLCTRKGWCRHLVTFFLSVYVLLNTIAYRFATNVPHQASVPCASTRKWMRYLFIVFGLIISIFILYYIFGSISRSTPHSASDDSSSPDSNRSAAVLSLLCDLTNTIRNFCYHSAHELSHFSSTIAHCLFRPFSTTREGITDPPSDHHPDPSTDHHPDPSTYSHLDPSTDYHPDHSTDYHQDHSNDDNLDSYTDHATDPVQKAGASPTSQTMPEIVRLRDEVRRLAQTVASQHQQIKILKSHFAQRVKKDSELADAKINTGLAIRSSFVHQKQLMERHTSDMRRYIDSRVANISHTLTQQTREHVRKEMLRALHLYDADRTGEFDFALEAAGAVLESTGCTRTYERSSSQFSFLQLPFWKVFSNPRVILQPVKGPGSCFAFVGSGYFLIRLSYPIQPSEFIVEHISPLLTPNNSITSAPKDFSVYGIRAAQEDGHSEANGVSLGDFVYETNGPPLQRFPATLLPGDAQVFRHVQLQVHSNWGHPHYTCLYRFRVHGSLADIAS